LPQPARPQATERPPTPAPRPPPLAAPILKEQRRDAVATLPQPPRPQPTERPPTPAPRPPPVAAPVLKEQRRDASATIAAPTPPAAKPKERPQTQSFQKRLWANIGSETGIVAIDIVNTISGETGLPGSIVGAVDIRERHLFVDVAAEHANVIIAKLNRTQIKGRKIKVKAA